MKYHNRLGHALVAYLVPQEYMMAHLIADLGEHEAHHGKAGEQGALAVMKHLGEMYGLKPCVNSATAEPRASGESFSPKPWHPMDKVFRLGARSMWMFFVTLFSLPN